MGNKMERGWEVAQGLEIVLGLGRFIFQCNLLIVAYQYIHFFQLAQNCPTSLIKINQILPLSRSHINHSPFVTINPINH